MPFDKFEIVKAYEQLDVTNARSIEEYAMYLKKGIVQDILDLGIYPDGFSEKDYSSKNFKGGLGNLIEERFFGYKANSDSSADFPDAGVELKTTCYDTKPNGEKAAGERLVLSMIPHDQEIPLELEDSHVWEKCRQMLIIYYERDKNKPLYAREITDVGLFRIPEEDLEIIREDYRTIATLIREGRADELSEGMTRYLGACTKGQNAESSVRPQFYPYIDPNTGEKTYRTAKRRAFCLKQPYMNYILHQYFLHDEAAAEKIIKRISARKNETFDERIINMLKPYFGKTDKDICQSLSIPYTGNKSQWTTIVYRMLGIKNSRAEEFIKAGIDLHCIRVKYNGKIKEHLSFPTFESNELIKQDWELSEFRKSLEESRFLFVIFRRDTEGELRLAGARFWSMPVADIEGEAKRCWEETKSTFIKGVIFRATTDKNGKTKYSNNLPGSKNNSVAHVRPHAQKAAYSFKDGTVIGNLSRDADELPDGQWMTKQCFWLNNSYLEEQLGTRKQS